jgi:hypothetical protein
LQFVWFSLNSWNTSNNWSAVSAAGTDNGGAPVASPELLTIDLTRASAPTTDTVTDRRHAQGRHPVPLIFEVPDRCRSAVLFVEVLRNLQFSTPRLPVY